MSAGFTIAFDDLGAAAGLASLRAFGGDLTPLMDRVGEIFEASTVDRFDSERAPDGTPWVPSRRALRDGGQTLTDKARLRGSITHRSGGTFAEIGSNVPYAGVHQDGIDRDVGVPAHARLIAQAFGRKLKTPRSVEVKAHTRRMRIVARPYLGVSDGDRADVLAAVGDAVVDALNGRP